MKRLGLCLTGGGARGAYQVGAAKALEELGLFQQIHAFSGTSIGSVNACLLATKTVDEVKDLWLKFPVTELKSAENLFKMIRERKLGIVNQGIYEIDGLEKLLRQELDTEELRKKLVFVTLSPAGIDKEGAMGILRASFNHFIKNESQVIYSPIYEQTDEFIYKQILASCSIPFVFPSVNIDGQQVFDGGLYDNIPIKPLIDAGCDTVIVIHLHRIFFINKNKYPGIQIKEIRHWKSLGGVLNFDLEQASKRYKLGYEDTMKYFSENQIN
jgi:NTE family protein